MSNKAMPYPGPSPNFFFAKILILPAPMQRYRLPLLRIRVSILRKINDSVIVIVR